MVAMPAFCQNCVPAATLSPNDAQTGELTAQSCRLTDSTMVAEYRLILPVRGTLQLSAKGAGFTPLFVVRDSNGRRVESGTSISHYMESGTYLILVNGSVMGKFSVSSVFQPEPNVLCTVLNRVGAGQSITGQLTAASCKLPDGSPYDGWQTTVFGAGTLTVTMHSTSFDSFLILRVEDGTPLATAGNGGAGTDAQITLPVSGRETYSILSGAATASAKPGAYQLSIVFSADPEDTCLPIRVLSDPMQLTGSVSTASCNFNLPQRQDSSLFNIYGIHVAEAGTAQITVLTSTFTPLLLLLDVNGNPIVEDSESGGLFTPLIRQSLPPGDYSVLIYNEDSLEGDYTLQYSFTPGAAAVCSALSIASGQTLTGALSGDTNCRYSELLSDGYRFTLASASTVEIGLASGDFTTFLELHDAKDNLLDYSDQSSNGASAYIRADLPAGTYSLVAASTDLPGTYSLNAQFTPKVIPACTTVHDLAVNTGFVGTLGQGACNGPAGEPVDYYRFTIAADGIAALVMTSGDLDSYLKLTDASGKVLREDNNSYSQSDALIVQYLKAGTYKLEARSRSNPKAGRYRVDLLWTAGTKPSFCAAAPVRIGVPVSTSLTYTGCQYYDNTFANIYQLTVTDSSKPVDISADSTGFDAFLVLTDAKGNVLSSDDNSGGGTDAHLNITLDLGTYCVVVKPAGDPSESGAYRLLIQQ